MNIHGEVPTKYLVFGIILCICIGIVVAYFSYPKLDPITLPEEAIQYQLPQKPERNIVEQQVPDDIKNRDQTKNEQESFCIQVITTAKDPITGETKDFPTPCDVPEGWIIVENSKQ